LIVETAYHQFRSTAVYLRPYYFNLRVDETVAFLPRCEAVIFR